MKTYVLNFLLCMMSVSSMLSCAGLPLEEQIDYDAKWIMVIESVSNNRKELTLTNSDCTAPVKKGDTFIYDNVGGKDIDLQLTYAESKDCKGALEISAVIENNEEDWMVKLIGCKT